MHPPASTPPMRSSIDGGLMPMVAAIVFLTMLGAAWPVLFGEGSPVGKWLQHQELVGAIDDAGFAAAMEAQLYGEETPESGIATHDPAPLLSQIRRADQAAAVLCLVLTAALPFLGLWKRPLAYLYLLPAAWLLINAHAAAISGGKAFAELSIPAHATRWMLPVVLAGLMLKLSASKPAANVLLRIACAMTFAIHGWEALKLNPPFQDLLYTTGAMVGIPLSATVCHGLLHAIACMDGLLAISVLLIHSPRALRWMAAWGLITAISRPLTMGWETWPELAVRLANGACPWLILAIGLPGLIKRRHHTEAKHPDPLKSS